MDKEDSYIASLIIVIVIIASTILICSIIFEPIQKKLERTCSQYGMEYHYRNNGQYCMEDDGTIHPVATNCPSVIRGSYCEITFIK